MTNRAAIYVRVSSDEQTKGYSIPTQLEACRKYAQEHDYAVSSEFIEDYTGTELDRPALSKLREHVQKGDADTVLVYDIDRLARNVYLQMHLEREFTGLSVRTEYVIGQYKDTPEGQLLKRIKADIAEYENAQRVERSRRGKRGRAMAGFVLMPTGRAPFGYDYVSEPHKGYLVVNEEQATVVRMIYQWLVEDGLSSYAIAKKLWEEGILSKGDFSHVVVKKAGRGEWSPATVRKIVSNPVYKGTWCYGKTRRRERKGKKVQEQVPRSDWIEVTVPAIVKTDMWDEAQKCLLKNKANAPRNTKRQYLLRGMVFCSCGRRWTGRYKNHLNRAYYRCPTSEAEHWRQRCTMPGGIRQETLEEVVWNTAVKTLLDPTSLRIEIERRRSEAETIKTKATKRVQEIYAAQQELDRRLGLLLDQLLSGSFPGPVIEQRKKMLLEQQAQLRSELERLQGESETAAMGLEHEEEVVAFIEDVRQGFANFTFEEKRRVLELVDLRVDILDQEHLKVNVIIGPGTIVTTSSA